MNEILPKPRCVERVRLRSFHVISLRYKMAFVCLCVRPCAPISETSKMEAARRLLRGQVELKGHEDIVHFVCVKCVSMCDVSGCRARGEVNFLSLALVISGSSPPPSAATAARAPRRFPLRTVACGSFSRCKYIRV